NLAARSAEEVDLGDDGETLPEAGHVRLGPEAPIAAAPTLGDGPSFVSDLPVVRLAGGIEECLDMVVRQPFDEPRFADRGVAATLHDLTLEPLEVLLGLVGPGRHVHRVLDGHRPQELG